MVVDCCQAFRRLGHSCCLFGLLSHLFIALRVQRNINTGNVHESVREEQIGERGSETQRQRKFCSERGATGSPGTKAATHRATTSTCSTHLTPLALHARRLLHSPALMRHNADVISSMSLPARLLRVTEDQPFDTICAEVQPDTPDSSAQSHDLHPSLE